MPDECPFCHADLSADGARLLHALFANHDAEEEDL